MRNFISKLQNRRQTYLQSVSTDGSKRLKPYATIEDYVLQFFTTFSKCHLTIVDKNEFKNYIPTESLCTYLATLNKCMIFISNVDGSLEKKQYSTVESQSAMNIEKRMRIVHSPYYKLVFSTCKAKSKYPNTANHPAPKSEPHIFPLNARYNNYIELQYYTHLQHIAYALRDTILFCPYSTYIKFPTNYKKSDGSFDKRKKKEILHDFEKYSNESGQIVLDLNKTSLPLPLNLLSPEIQEMIAMLGGPAIVELFYHMNDFTYNNKQLESKKDITRFFVKTYTNYLDTCGPASDTGDYIPLLFNHFSFEAILNGSFLMYFCNYFSSQNKMIPTFSKKIPNEDFNVFFSDLYKKMNRIENPFLKCDLLDKVIHPSFFQNYEYNGNNRSAGQENFSIWKNDILQYINSLIEMEQELYKKYLSFTSDKIKEPEPKSLITKYDDLYKKSIMDLSPGSTKKRGTIYAELLPKIAAANYYYYPVWPNF